MKKMFLHLVVFIVIFLCGHGISHANLSDGLIAYYPFDGDANDKSGNGNHGIVYGSTLVEDVYGNPNGAYYFDGMSNYIEVPRKESLKITTSLSIGSWVYIESYAGGWSPIICKGNTSSMKSPYALLGLSNNPALLLNRENLVGSSIIPQNQWVHIAATWDGATVRFYINGIEDPVTQEFSNPLGVTDESLIIGSDPPGQNEWFHGKLDEIRIYNRALSESEIQLLADKLQAQMSVH